MGHKALLVYPQIPATYWSFRYALPFIGKKAAFPPLGLLTVAALLPEDFEVSLVDMNVEALTASAVAGADLVLTSSMIIQKDSLQEVIRLCRACGTPVVAGGPYPTSCSERISGVDHFVLGEAEVTLPPFLEDFRAGRARPLYRDPAKPDITRTPPPRLDLLRPGDYGTLALQYSRGCPHACEFCDIIEMFGRVPRTKSPGQFVGEMALLYRSGWRGSLFVVDDNFIGNRKEVKKLLPEVAAWQEAHRYPFALFTEATLDLAADGELMEGMVKAGFNMVFLGIETPDAATLRAAGKHHNLKLDMLEGVRRIQRAGMEVCGGFIVGFDGDPPDVFDRQIRFIQDAGIPTAMVGLLTAIPNTRLYRRLEAEGRLTDDSTGNNTHDLRLNFVPRMDARTLLAGYKRVIAEIYAPDRYFERCLRLLKNLKTHETSERRIRATELRAFALSLLLQTFSPYGLAYWRFLLRGFFRKPWLAAEIVTMAIKGHHFFKMTRRVLEVEDFKQRVEKLARSFQERATGPTLPDLELRVAELRAHRDQMLRNIAAEYRRLHKDFHVYAEQSLQDFRSRSDELIARLAAQKTLAHGT